MTAEQLLGIPRLLPQTASVDAERFNALFLLVLAITGATAAVVIALSMLLGFHSPASSGTGRAVAAAQTAPALVAGESRDHAGGAREDRHRDLPAKRARLIALKVKTTRAPGHIRHR